MGGNINMRTVLKAKEKVYFIGLSEPNSARLKNHLSEMNIDFSITDINDGVQFQIIADEIQKNQVNTFLNEQAIDKALKFIPDIEVGYSLADFLDEDKLTPKEEAGNYLTNDRIFEPNEMELMIDDMNERIKVLEYVVQQLDQGITSKNIKIKPINPKSKFVLKGWD